MTTRDQEAVSSSSRARPDLVLELAGGFLGSHRKYRTALVRCAWTDNKNDSDKVLKAYCLLGADPAGNRDDGAEGQKGSARR